MFTNNVLNAVKPLVDEYEQYRFRLVPRPGTPLEAVLAKGYTPEMDMKDDATTPMGLVELGGTAVDNDGIRAHDAAMDEVTDAIGSVVAMMLTHARTVFAPLEKDVLEKVEEHLENLTNKARRHNIEVVNSPEILKNEILMSMIDKYSTASRREVNYDKDAIVGPLDHAGIKELLTTGMDRLDSDVQAALDNQTGVFLADTYDHFIRGIHRFEETLPIHHVIVLLIARALPDNVPDETRMSLSELRAFAAILANNAGFELHRIIQRGAQAVQRQRLVEHMPKDTDFETPIRVNGEVYKKWLSEGGVPEILMGAALSGERAYGYVQLLENRDHYMRIFQSAQRMVNLRLTANKTKELVSAVRASLTEMINEGDSTFKDDAPTLHRRLNDVLASIPVDASTCSVKYVRQVISKVLYPHTDSERILNLIDSYVEKEETSDVREAATLAVVDLVVEHVASQFAVQC